MIKNLPFEIIYKIIKECFFESINKLKMTCSFFEKYIKNLRKNKNIEYIKINIIRNENRMIYWNLFNFEFYIEQKNKNYLFLESENRKNGRKKGFFNFKKTFLFYLKPEFGKNKEYFTIKDFILQIENKRIFEIINFYKENIELKNLVKFRKNLEKDFLIDDIEK